MSVPKIEHLPEQRPAPSPLRAPVRVLFISDTARSNIPALGYAGTYAIANVLLTLAGTLIIIIWPGLG